jgi:hypothetical protein
MGRPIDESFAELEELRQKYPELLNVGDNTGEDRCPREWITQAEAALGVKFPPSYVRFLLRYGGGELGGNEISSLYGPREPEVTAIGDVVRATVGDWELWNSPRHLVLLMDQEGDVKYYLDTSSANSDGEYPVVRWAIEAREKLVHCADNFVEFLVQRMKWLGPYW